MLYMHTWLLPRFPSSHHQCNEHTSISVPTFKPNSTDFSILQAYPNLPIFVQAFLPSSCEEDVYYFAFCFSLTQSSNMDSHAFGMSSSNVDNVYLLLLPNKHKHLYVINCSNNKICYFKQFI